MVTSLASFGRVGCAKLHRTRAKGAPGISQRRTRICRRLVPVSKGTELRHHHVKWTVLPYLVLEMQTFAHFLVSVD